MLYGFVPEDSLETAVKCWMAAGMPDYANGHTERYKPTDLKMAPMYTPELKRTPYKRFKR